VQTIATGFDKLFGVTGDELPLVLLYEVPQLWDADRENLANDRYTVRGVVVELVPPIDWRMDPVDNLNWRFWFHAMQHLDVPLRIYEQDDDPEALAKARDMMLAWVSGNPIGGETTGDYAWFDMSAGIRASFLGYVWRECRRRDLLDSDQESQLTESLRTHARWLSDEENYTGQTNHGLFQDAGLYLMAAYAADLPESEEWREFVEDRFLTTLRKHVDFEEGVHKEQSPSYHFYIRDVVKRLNEHAGIGGEQLAELVRKLDDAAGWMVLPDGRMTPFGDTDLEEAPEFAREAAHKEGLRAFLRTGYAFVRENGSYLAMTCTYHSHAHNHADALSWCLFEDGHLVVGEAGRYGYRDEEDPARIYARASHGHNVLILDDESFPWKDRGAYGSGLLAAGEDDGWYVILGRNPLLEPVDHRRVLLYRPGELVIVVDGLKAEDEHVVDRRLHFGPDLVAEQSGGTVVAKDEDGRVIATLFDASGISVETSVARGVEEPRMDGWTFPSDLTKVPSDVVTLRSTLASGLLIHGLALSSSVPESVTARADGRQMVVEVVGTEGSYEVAIAPSPELSVDSVSRSPVASS
jgi:hypothetical protein